MAPYTLHHGDCRDILATLPDCSVDSVVTDPPYGLSREPDAHEVLRHWLAGDDYEHRGGGFMGKSWDSFVPGPSVWREVYRVLKPGGHMAVFGGTRTYDLLTLAIRLAGFEIRENLQYIYGSGFPKSLSVHKATVKRIESRYAENRCDCVDSDDGRSSGDGRGSEGGAGAWAAGEQRQVQENPAGDTGISDDARRSGNPVPHVRQGDDEEVTRRTESQEAVLHAPVRRCGAETTGLGDSSLWAGLEEQASGNTQAGQGMPSVQDLAGGTWQGTPRSSHSSVQIRRDEQPHESGGAVRFMSSQDRVADDGHIGSAANSREPRRLRLDGETGGRDSVCWVCSWCGLPDRSFIASLEPFGTALKPAVEPVVLARKPLGGRTVAANVLEWGTGALNIDGARVAASDAAQYQANCEPWSKWQRGDSILADAKGMNTPGRVAPMPKTDAGRWPANVIFDTEAGAVLDEQSGVSKSQETHFSVRGRSGGILGKEGKPRDYVGGHNDTGGASRFFTSIDWNPEIDVPFRYVAKPSKRERNCEGTVANVHATVKPLALMRWLVRLMTPPGGTVLEPFAGSGTTLMAAIMEHHPVIGIEMTDEYLPIIEGRCAWAIANTEPPQEALF